MSKEDLIEMRGRVDEVLPDARYRVTLDNGHQLVAYSAGRMRKHRIRILAGDFVSLELSPYDLGKGRGQGSHHLPPPGGPGAARAAPGRAAALNFLTGLNGSTVDPT